MKQEQDSRTRRIYQVKCFWLVVSTHLKNISQNGNLPQVGMKINNIWNHQPGLLIPSKSWKSLTFMLTQCFLMLMPMEIAFVFGFQVRTARFKEFELQRFYPKYLAVKKNIPSFPISTAMFKKKSSNEIWHEFRANHLKHSVLPHVSQIMATNHGWFIAWLVSQIMDLQDGWLNLMPSL